MPFLSRLLEFAAGLHDADNVPAAAAPPHGTPHCGAVRSSMPTSFLSTLIINGVSGHEENCLVVDHGNFRDDDAEAAVEPCAQAIRKGDGREIWHLNPNGQIQSEIGEKCMVFQKSYKGGGPPTLQSCDEAAASSHNHSQFELTPDNQIRTRDGKLCLSLEDHSAFHGCGVSSLKKSSSSTAGVDAQAGGAFTRDALIPNPHVMSDQTAEATASSNSDAISHGPRLVLDGNSSTYWASAPVDYGGTESLTLSFPASKLDSVDIDWAFPPNSFELQTTTDGSYWTTVRKVWGNPLHSSISHLPLQGQWTVGVRLLMKEPDLVKGRYKGHLYYGIRNLRLHVPTYLPVLESCDKAARSPDARDKWFLSTVSQFSPCTRLAARKEKQEQQWNSDVIVDETWVKPQRSARHRDVAVSFLWAPNPGFSKDALVPLTQWRQDHRRTEDGYLCAAAAVHDRVAFTGCTDMPTPDGDVGRQWCYLEPQLLPHISGKTRLWGYCAPKIDYNAMRAQL